MPATHQPCWRDGVYRSSCCGREITLKLSAPAPRCDDCGNLTGWLPVRFIQVTFPGIRIDPSGKPSGVQPSV